MFKHYFESIENVEIWPIISLIIFFGYFVAMTIWIFRMDKKFIKKMENMPLDDSETD